MNHKLFEHVVSLLLVALLLSGCVAIPVGAPPELAAGEIMQLQPLTSTKGLLAAAGGARDTIRMAKDGLLMLVWYQEPGCGWACLSATAQDPFGMWRFMTGGRANWGSPATFANLRASLEAQDWRSVPPEAVPAALSTRARAWLVSAGQYRFTVLVIPLGAAIDFLPEEYSGWR